MKIKTELFNDNFQTEIWRDIPEYKGLYQASNMGKIRSLDRYVNNQANGKAKRLAKGRVLKTFTAGAGYEYVVLSVNQNKKKVAVHRLVAQAFLGVSELTVNHINENKKDNRVSNLEYCTQKENCNKGTRNKRLSMIKTQQHQEFKVKRDKLGRFVSC
jgi:hypothetical protein